MKRERMAKVVIIGEARVGKTSLLTRYTDGNFHENMIPTLGYILLYNDKELIIGLRDWMSMEWK